MWDFNFLSSQARDSQNIKLYFSEFKEFMINSNVETEMTLRFEFPNGFTCWIRCADNTSIPELWYVRIYRNGNLCEINSEGLGKENFISIKNGCIRRIQITAFSKEAVKDLIRTVKDFKS